jgi:hypothetical protein
MMDFDLKAVSGSATDQFGQSGFFNMFHANGPTFQFVSDYGNNLHPTAGWVHVDVPVGTPNDAMNALFAQVYDNGSASAFPGPNGLVEFRLDNVKFITTPPPPPPPGFSRGGHQFSFETADQIDSTHPGGQSAFQYKWGDSYSSSATTSITRNQISIPQTGNTPCICRRRQFPARMGWILRCFTTPATRTNSPPCSRAPSCCLTSPRPAMGQAIRRWKSI